MERECQGRKDVSIRSNFAENDGLAIHYLDSVDMADPCLTPVLICPGLSETAEEYADLMEELLPRRCIALSFRGRGQSDTPQQGYDLEHHVSDIAAVMGEACVPFIHLFGYSRGVSYALSYASQNKQKIASILVEDYPPEHRAMTVSWQEDYINNYVIPAKRNIRPAAVRGIQNDATQQDIFFTFERPVLVTRGMLSDALLTDEGIASYRNMFAAMQLREFLHSGHNIRGTEKQELYLAIQHFINNI